MYAQRSTEWPTLGYWPGQFSQVATRKRTAFTGPFTALSGARGMGAGCCYGDPMQLGTLGIFDSGLDLSGWGLPEWGVVAVGGYLLVTSFLTTRRGVSSVRKGLAARRSKRQRRASLKRQLKSL